MVKPAEGRPRLPAEGAVGDEPPGAGREHTPGKMHIPKGMYLMLGDNRAISDDSRVWGLSRAAT